MSWLLVAVVSYFLFAIASLIDKFLLAGPPKPKAYAFYVNLLGGLIILLIPFVGFTMLPLPEALICLLAGAAFVFSLLALYEGLEKHEASRLIPAMGGFTPLFTMIFTYLVMGQLSVSVKELVAFGLLIAGSILIAREHGKNLSKGSLLISAIAAFFLALHFVLAKQVYNMVPFWHGLIWIKIGALFTALFFLFSKEVRDDFTQKKPSFNKNTGMLFIINQIAGAAAAILQNLAIALAGGFYVAFVVALQGTEYLFIFILGLLFAWKFPKILKEKFTKKTIVQKITAIILISIGLALLAL